MQDEADRPLISYASPVAQGAGRTPIGIIMFAASHLLLGGVLVLAAVIIAERMPTARLAPGEAMVPYLIALAAMPMIAGGLALLLKGRAAWTAAVVSFAALAVFEAVTICYATAMTIRYLRQGNHDAVWAVSFLVLALCLGLLCATVVGYLAGSKARATFALPPGETSAGVRMLPRVILVLYAAAAATGPLFSGVRSLFPD